LALLHSGTQNAINEHSDVVKASQRDRSGIG
jgi:hypothetical protein